ncbi:Protein-tyrosine-phosphatase MKP1 [Apostasia shenzhenica]|uniref:Protein-tyrosine-phosphatase MKP1 n=1 Tax=Apostasia shenzhenica TaxID=1088818 RepID=A0A2I0BED1_9ASPA|nr:Protein-tyrosine-phosphatase MKP1 [Apostasia shenzhenica]
MDSEQESTTPRKALWRSASWSGRQSSAQTGRPPKPSRPLQPLSISRRGSASGWPCAASDDSGHTPATPSSSSVAAPAADDDLECSHVADHVFLGSEAAARDREALRRHGITHVLNCIGGACPEYFRGDLVYRTLWLHDSPAEDITSVLYDAFDYLEEVRTARTPARVLVHCRRGASRSATVVIAYLMWLHAKTFDEALRAVRSARAAADPNLGFASQLLQCQSRVLLSPSSSGIRAYRMAPHSPCDPLHLVPKIVSFPARLDSRGAFLLHVPSAVFVWLGRSCDSTMADAAAAAAHQVVRYERARGPILTVSEGFEPPDFWAAIPLDGDDGSVDFSSVGDVGERRVQLYDHDFGIFRRALEGEAEPQLPLSGSNLDTAVAVESAAMAVGPKEEEDTESSSVTPSSMSSETASILSTFSPASTSSSEASPSHSPLAELQKTLPSLPPLCIPSKLPPLHPRKNKEKDHSLPAHSLSLSGQRSGSAPSLVSFLPSEEMDRQGDLRLSPTFVSQVVECQKSRDFDSVRLGTTEVEEDVSTSGCNSLGHPLLFRWPGMDKVEEIHGTLDSSSVYMLLAPNSSSSRNAHKIVLFLWLGRKSRMINESGEVQGDGRNANLVRISTEFLDQMGFPLDITVQIVEEGEEPEQFVNHLFSLYGRAESSHRSGQTKEEQ